MESCFSPPDNNKYLLPSNKVYLTNPSILLNLMCKVLAIVYYYMIFHLFRYYQDQNLQF